MSETLTELGELLVKGGSVGPPLVLGALLLWWAMGYRFVMLVLIDRRNALDLYDAVRQGRLTNARGVVAQAAVEGYSVVQRGVPHLRSFLQEIFHGHRLELNRFRSVTEGIVKIAPLLGLLGTVSGMIDTFDSLGDTTAGANAGTGVAGGIAEALFSTQMGLLVAVPGLLVGRLLDRRQQVVEDELEKLEDVLVTRQQEVVS